MSKPTRVLFLCAANMCRSPTGEALLKGMAGYEVKSAGVCEGAVNVVNQELLDWADVVFVMEYWMKQALLEAGWSIVPMKIKVLGVKDSYYFGHPALVKTLAEKLNNYGIDVSTRVKDWTNETAWMMSHFVTKQTAIDKWTERVAKQ